VPTSFSHLLCPPCFPDPYLDGWSQETFPAFPQEWWNNQQFGVLLPVCPTPSSPGLTPGVGCSPVVSGGANESRVTSMYVPRPSTEPRAPHTPSVHVCV